MWVLLIKPNILRFGWKVYGYYTSRGKASNVLRRDWAPWRGERAVESQSFRAIQVKEARCS